MALNSLGWIKLHRSILDWEWYDDPNTKIMFLHLLLKANHKDKNYKGSIIKRGDLVTGRMVLSAELGMSEQQVRTSLNKLKSTNEITIKTTNKNSVISIVNYDLYQEKDDDQPTTQPTGSHQTTNGKPTSNQRLTTNKNVKNIKKEKNERSQEEDLFGASAHQKSYDDSDHVDNPEKEKEKNSAKKEKAFGKAEFRLALVMKGADPQHVEDWLKVRVAAKASFTETALNKLLSECERNNYPVAMAVQACAEYSWRGFEYQWILNKQKYATGQKAVSTSQNRQQRVDEVANLRGLAKSIISNGD
ncbi:hypothetical protein [Sphingobacterium paludis]|uniref:Phage replication protein O n=1 Tax=Sphingobacterium paludis TaxID=1476465 RepID=A0A4R7D4Y5_9SPHI|nr:hypothetical protein [Sphingobacterium paludis]TDS14765.1 hypothetical protein B0I21_103264 [Sphingobacterium paludis]